MLADVNEGALRAATDELTAGGHQALAVTCDVSDEAQVAALVERTVDTFGRLDMAFNNAGIMIPSDAADEPAENIDRVTAPPSHSQCVALRSVAGARRQFGARFGAHFDGERGREPCGVVVRRHVVQVAPTGYDRIAFALQEDSVPL